MLAVQLCAADEAGPRWKLRCQAPAPLHLPLPLAAHLPASPSRAGPFWLPVVASLGPAALGAQTPIHIGRSARQCRPRIPLQRLLHQTELWSLFLSLLFRIGLPYLRLHQSITFNQCWDEPGWCLAHSSHPSKTAAVQGQYLRRLVLVNEKSSCPDFPFFFPPFHLPTNDEAPSPKAFRQPPHRLFPNQYGPT